MKRRSQATTKKQSKNPTSALSPPAAKRSKKTQMEIFNNTTDPQREMILRTFYQWESEGTTEISERARKQFESELKASFSPYWSIRFREELFDDETCGISLKSIMNIKNIQERQARVLYILLERTEQRGSYGSGEVQFLIDHLCGGNRSLSNDRSVVYSNCLKTVEILADLYLLDGSNDSYTDEFDHRLNLWWKKKPHDILVVDTKVYGKKLTFSEKMEWFKYYENHWKRWNSNIAWLSFIWAIAGGFFFHQRFITTRGKPMYDRFNERL